MLCLSRIVITCTYRHVAKDDLLQLKVQLWRFTIYKFETPMIHFNEVQQSVTFTEESESAGADKTEKKKWTWHTMIHFWRDSRRMLKQVVDLKGKVYAFLAHVTVQSFSWRTELGTGDAASAAKIAGLLWGVKGSLCGYLGTKLKWQKPPNLIVVPHYQAAGWAVSFSCIVSFRLGHAIRTGIKLIRARKAHAQSSNDSYQTG